ncbi:hypothetical protein TPSD3_12565 [Thioflexithrix psekupsensis]|jgi:NADH:ubiquinone oxidoreductase subunit E|uniref:NADH dehydrogenase n=2 Tax=Pseudomonadati TaxID=3379134 RepID=A0A251X5N4_9GAMM|nr:MULTISPECIES: hypothetical protein [Bacteria]OUD12760.1 hypothetical protein TPSD3_12565 [Thioflexithrix psekupsensis]QEN08764.1 (2Fe-2S) ferredoxin domain-containing protein [Oceanispirochaeta crateris]
MKSPKTITICMGSSCFSRGNNQNLKIIQEIISGYEGIDVQLSGALCQEQCSKGPVLYLGDTMFSCVDSSEIADLVETYINS